MVKMDIVVHNKGHLLQVIQWDGGSKVDAEDCFQRTDSREMPQNSGSVSYDGKTRPFKLLREANIPSCSLKATRPILEADIGIDRHRDGHTVRI